MFSWTFSIVLFSHGIGLAMLQARQITTIPPKRTKSGVARQTRTYPAESGFKTQSNPY